MDSETAIVRCLVKGEPWESNFTIKIYKDQTIEMLKQRIKQAITTNAQYASFKLYGVSLAKQDKTRLSEIYGQLGNQQHRMLDSMDTVEEALPTRKEKHIHVIVELPGTLFSV